MFFAIFIRDRFDSVVVVFMVVFVWPFWYKMLTTTSFLSLVIMWRWPLNLLKMKKSEFPFCTCAINRMLVKKKYDFIYFLYHYLHVFSLSKNNIKKVLPLNGSFAQHFVIKSNCKCAFVVDIQGMTVLYWKIFIYWLESLHHFWERQLKSEISI